MNYFKSIAVFIIISFLLINYNSISQNAPIKIGEMIGNQAIITHDINDIKQAIMQEVGDCDIISIVNIIIAPSGNIWLDAKGTYGTDSRNYRAPMYVDNGNIYMLRGSTDHKCSGHLCSECDYIYDAGTLNPTGCKCIRGTSGNCVYSSEPTPNNSIAHVERYLVY